MPLTLQHLHIQFPGWQIIHVSGGWAAVRAEGVPKGSALSNVRCGKTLDDLAENLRAEIRLQKSLRPAPHE